LPPLRCQGVIVAPPIEAYLERLQPTHDRVQARMEAEGKNRKFPIIGPLVGNLVSLMAQSIEARRVFEMGSGFGYSTLHFARAVGDGGEVVHTDGDADLSREAQRWLAEAGLDDRVRFEVGDAVGLLAKETEVFDVIFCDIDKGNYPRAWEVARERVRRGGLIITDNTLWSGAVADPDDEEDWTKAIRHYNRLAFGDGAFRSTLLPVRDGVTVSLRVA
jgi:caffeoyl-CoA O-methyltransferase